MKNLKLYIILFVVFGLISFAGCYTQIYVPEYHKKKYENEEAKQYQENNDYYAENDTTYTDSTYADSDYYNEENPYYSGEDNIYNYYFDGPYYKPFYRKYYWG